MDAAIKPRPARRAVAILVGICLLLLAAPDSTLAADGIPLHALTADLKARDQLPQSPLPPSQWYETPGSGSWGPKAATYPPVDVPAGYDAVAWKRARLAAVARRLIGLPYRHHHIPAYDPPGQGRGLDCSNFTSWVYNYGLGIRFTSAVAAQAPSRRSPGAGPSTVAG